MGAGPLVAAAGILFLLRTGIDTSYVAELLPALLLFSLGLSMTVAPLTAAVLADADESDAGIASAINNAIARVAGLVGVSVVGVVVASTLVGDSFAANDESVRAFHQVVVICAALVAAGASRASSASRTRDRRSRPRGARGVSCTVSPSPPSSSPGRHPRQLQNPYPGRRDGRSADPRDDRGARRRGA